MYVVGYTTSTIQKAGQINITGAQFLTIGEEYINLQDISVSGQFDPGTVWIKWWDPVKKAFSPEAVYVNQLFNPDETPVVPTTPGWADGEFWVEIPKTFAPGEGFWWGCNDDNVSLTVSGAVYVPETKSHAISFAKAGQQLHIISPFPTDLNLQTISVEGVFDSGTVWIKWWDPVAKVYNEAVYVDQLFNPDETPVVPTTPGWADGDFWVEIQKTFAPGEGFVCGGDFDDLMFLIPNPFVEK